MFNKKSMILILLAIFCIGITISSVSANDVDNSTLNAVNSNDEMNSISDELSTNENKDILQSTENEPIYSSTNETIISSSSTDKLGSSTWSGSDKETFYLRLISTDYVKSDSSQQIMVQSIKTSDQPYSRNVYYNVINSAGNVVYNFHFDIYPNQIVYFDSNANVFSKLPAGTYKCVISEYNIDTLGKYNSVPGYDGIKWEVVKKAPVKTTIALKAVTVKKSAKKLVLQATLKKGSSPIKSKYVAFKFNGKTYKAKTNSKGIAKYTIKSSILKKLKVGNTIKYQASYGKIIAKKTAKVKK